MLGAQSTRPRPRRQNGTHPRFEVSQLHNAALVTTYSCRRIQWNCRTCHTSETLQLIESNRVIRASIVGDSPLHPPSSRAGSWRPVVEQQRTPWTLFPPPMAHNASSCPPLLPVRWSAPSSRAPGAAAPTSATAPASPPFPTVTPTRPSATTPSTDLSECCARYTPGEAPRQCFEKRCTAVVGRARGEWRHGRARKRARRLLEFERCAGVPVRACGGCCSKRGLSRWCSCGNERRRLVGELFQGVVGRGLRE